MSLTEGVFQSALDNFKKRLSPKELADFEITSLKDVREVVARIQKEQESVKQMMNMPRIQSFLEAMKQFGNIVEVYLNASQFVAFVWGPVKFLLQVRQSISDSVTMVWEIVAPISIQSKWRR